MLKKIFAVFQRDLKVNLRNFLTIYLMIAPFLLAFAINFLVPSVNDTTINLVMLESANPDYVANLEQYARVELVKNMDAAITRVEQRDDMIAVLEDSQTGNYYVLQQGNETPEIVEFAKLLKSFVELDYQVDQSNVEIKDFGRTEPPLKAILVNLCVIFITILGGMLIAINIVEEKMDNTVSAINVTPLSRVGFLIGKSMIGVILSLYSAVAILWITGYRHVNFGMLLVQLFVITILSILMGFAQGINSNDVMDAAAGLKMMFLPVIGAVAAAEFLADKWQWVCYWIPYYWTYLGTDAILSDVATWPQILFYSAITLGITAVIFAILAPRVHKGLQ